VTQFLLGLFLVLMAVGGGLAVLPLLAQSSTSTALYTYAVNITNTGSNDQDDVVVSVNLSAAELIDGEFIAQGALNTIVQKSGVNVPAMPATGRIQVEGAVQQDGGVFTEYTTAAQNATANDLPLLPTAAVDDAFYFGCDNPCRILTVDIDTAGVGTWTILWEYWDGSSFTALSGVDDRTNGFTSLGRRTVSWDMPTDWATQTVTGSSVNSYWARARASAVTSQTVAPLGTRARYENGQWWTWVEDLDVNNQEQYTIYVGGSTNLVSTHQIFPGTTGIITGDDAGLELGNAYSIGVTGRVNTSAPSGSDCIVCKTGAITINVTGSAAAPGIGTALVGGSNPSGDILGIGLPGTGSQTIIIAADGTNGATFFSGSTGGMLSYTAVSITDTANNWTWASNGALDYIDSIRIDAVAPTVFDFSTTFTDFDSGTQTGTQAYTGALGLDN